MTSPAAGVPFERLVEHRDFVRSLARSLVRDPHRADDLEQDVWATALAHPPRHEAGLRGWFRRIVRSRAVDAARGANRRTALVEGAARAAAQRGTPGPDDLAARLDAGRRVAHAVSELDEPYRAVVLLRFYEDLEPSEIAARTGVPLETVRTRLRRAIERVRATLDAGPGGRDAWMAALVPLAWPAGALSAGTGASAGAGVGGSATGAGTSGWIAGGAAMSAKATIGAAAIAAAAGAVIGSVVTLGAAASSSPPVPPDMATVTETKELRQRLEAAETRLAQATANQTRAADQRAAEQEHRVAELESAVASLRESVAARAAAPMDPRAPGRTPSAGRDAGTGAAPAPAGAASGASVEDARKKVAETIEALRRKLADTSLADAARLEALTALRAVPGALDAPTVETAAAFFRSTASADSRDTILRDLHRVSDPAAVVVTRRLFIEAMRDADERVRERAAGDADTYVSDPEVRTALERVQTDDASEKVRRRAARTLLDAK